MFSIHFCEENFKIKMSLKFNFYLRLGTIQLLRKDIGVARWFRKWQFPIIYKLDTIPKPLYAYVLLQFIFKSR